MTVFLCVRLLVRWRVCTVSMTTHNMWFQVVKEEEKRDRGKLRKLTVALLNPTISPAKLNCRYDNCLHRLPPVGNVRTLPLLPCKRVSPRPWSCGAFKFVWNSTARLLHPTWREENRREQEMTQICWLKVGRQTPSQNNTKHWRELSGSLPDKCQIITATK